MLIAVASAIVLYQSRDEVDCWNNQHFDFVRPQIVPSYTAATVENE